MRVYYVTKRALSVDDRRLTRESSKEKKKKKKQINTFFLKNLRVYHYQENDRAGRGSLSCTLAVFYMDCHTVVTKNVLLSSIIQIYIFC